MNRIDYLHTLHINVSSTQHISEEEFLIIIMSLLGRRSGTWLGEGISMVLPRWPVLRRQIVSNYSQIN